MKYPLVVVWSEARIVRQREATRLKGEAVTMQTVVASLFSDEGGKAFHELLQEIGDGE